MAIDEEPRFGGGILGSAKPTVDPNIRKLVQMGVRALPSLLEHLSDARPTKLVQEHDGDFGAMWYSTEFDNRYSDSSKQPKRPKGDAKEREFDFDNVILKHTFTVGDLCYIVIGQIVNRRYTAMRYQPTACVVINSPTKTPWLASAVRQDWGGITAEDHRRQLSDDANSLWPYAAGEALKRLLYYYPQQGEALAVRFLKREFYDYVAVWNFADERLMKTGSPARWKNLLVEAETKFGREAAKLLPHWVHWSNRETSTHHPKEMQDRATELLRTTFPAYRSNKNVFYNVVSIGDQKELIESLHAFRSRKIDEAVQDVFRRLMRYKPTSVKDPEQLFYALVEMDELAIECAKRMAGKGFDEEYLSYFNKRLPLLLKANKPSYLRGNPDAMKSMIKRLKGGR